ncbi:ATPase [Gymnodinialimonas ceratoperidinii]|uniref:ATPase n=1 Tax=Gymnodinialimonas ceratoperidinii TaxID=2856823 RepID=A0A8F6TTX3_9RHOB|nr:ATPase [Gymnodinialimonas ceratoperidinii]QXT38398.1 ATPase [Gymnodinialimonas ceratoperidinii]
MELIYDSPQAFLDAPAKRVAVFGMSGLGKTVLSNKLRESGDWFHYSVDYRIGTAYMGEHIADNLKAQAMQVPMLAELLRSDSIYIGSNITFGNLAPLSTFLGKPGDPAKGGLPFDEYKRRQALHRRAEVNALLDTVPFVLRASSLYGYENFICDTGGSICAVVDPSDPADEVLRTLAASLLMIWIETPEGHDAELIRRFKLNPKPIYYQPELLESLWSEYLDTHGLSEAQVDPDDFAVHAFSRVIHSRAPLYAAMAKNWGVSVTAGEVEAVRDAHDAEEMIARALAKPRPSA